MFDPAVMQVVRQLNLTLAYFIAQGFALYHLCRGEFLETCPWLIAGVLLLGVQRILLVIDPAPASAPDPDRFRHRPARVVPLRRDDLRLAP